MFGINFHRPIKVSSPEEIEPHITLLEREQFGNPPASHFPDEIEIPGVSYFSLDKTIVGKIKTPLYRGFGKVASVQELHLEAPPSYLVSCSIGSKKGGLEATMVGFSTEDNMETYSQEFTRFVISYALFNIVQGEPTLSDGSIESLDDSPLISSLWEEFHRTAK